MNFHWLPWTWCDGHPSMDFHEKFHFSTEFHEPLVELSWKSMEFHGSPMKFFKNSYYILDHWISGAGKTNLFRPWVRRRTPISWVRRNAQFFLFQRCARRRHGGMGKRVNWVKKVAAELKTFDNFRIHIYRQEATLSPKRACLLFTRWHTDISACGVPWSSASRHRHFARMNECDWGPSSRMPVLIHF